MASTRSNRASPEKARSTSPNSLPRKRTSAFWTTAGGARLTSPPVERADETALVGSLAGRQFDESGGIAQGKVVTRGIGGLWARPWLAPFVALHRHRQEAGKRQFQIHARGERD